MGRHRYREGLEGDAQGCFERFKKYVEDLGAGSDSRAGRKDRGTWSSPGMGEVVAGFFYPYKVYAEVNP